LPLKDAKVKYAIRFKKDMRRLSTEGEMEEEEKVKDLEKFAIDASPGGV
jgi:hypothetical protein